MNAASVSKPARWGAHAGRVHSTSGSCRAIPYPQITSASPTMEATEYAPFQPFSPIWAIQALRHPSATMRTECTPRKISRPNIRTDMAGSFSQTHARCRAQGGGGNTRSVIDGCLSKEQTPLGPDPEGRFAAAYNAL